MSNYKYIIEEIHSGLRVDILLSNKLALSRSSISKLAKDNNIFCNGKNIKPSYSLKRNDIIEIFIPSPKVSPLEPIDQPLNILYQDSDIAVINKPPNLVVHQGAGVKLPTLVNLLLFHCKDLSGISGELRPGIVHRLDKETSGVMVIAKNDKSHVNLSSQFKNRVVSKTYLAIVHGHIQQESGNINLKIGRDKKNRLKISNNSSSLREAETDWRVIERFKKFTLIEAYPKTGRTHQIRVHLDSIGCPILGDKIYGSRKRVNVIKNLKIDRHMLHAKKLEFLHPVTNKNLSFTANPQDDFDSILSTIRSIDE
tara:strand:+ start:351 stop:1283 length:933 start_codon:yes stop_codon:yes gene_type:complete